MKISALAMMVLAILSLSCFAFAGIIGTNDKDVKITSDPIIDNIISQLEDEKIPKYADFDEKTKKEILTFNQRVTGNLGSYQSREYLGFLNQNDKTIVIYKAAFEKTKNDVLLTTVISKKAGGIYQVLFEIYLENAVQSNFAIQIKESWFKSQIK
jgi:hypothetical protein